MSVTDLCAIIDIFFVSVIAFTILFQHIIDPITEEFERMREDEKEVKEDGETKEDV